MNQLPIRKIIWRGTWPVAGILLGLLAVSSVQAAQLVTFQGGQAIVVQRVEESEGWYFLYLEGGGEVGVPIDRVAYIEEYEAPPPSRANAAPPRAANVQNSGALVPSPGQGQSNQVAKTVPATAQSGGVVGPGRNSGQTSQPRPTAVRGDWRERTKMGGNSGSSREVGRRNNGQVGRRGSGGAKFQGKTSNPYLRQSGKQKQQD